MLPSRHIFTTDRAEMRITASGSTQLLVMVTDVTGRFAWDFINTHVLWECLAFVYL